MKEYVKSDNYKFTNSSSLNEFIDKAKLVSKDLKLYEKYKENIVFLNTTDIDFYVKFLNDMAHFVAYNNKKELEELRKGEHEK